MFWEAFIDLEKKYALGPIESQDQYQGALEMIQVLGTRQGGLDPGEIAYARTLIDHIKSFQQKIIEQGSMLEETPFQRRLKIFGETKQFGESQDYQPIVDLYDQVALCRPMQNLSDETLLHVAHLLIDAVDQRRQA